MTTPAEAAAATLAAGSCRIRESFRNAWDVGVIDFTHRRVEMEHHLESRFVADTASRTLYDGDDRLVDGIEGVYRFEDMPGPLRIIERIAAADSDGIYYETTLDAAGRLARIVWSRNPRARPRRLRPPKRYWTTLDLWDYGIPVDITIPESIAPDYSAGPLRSFVRSYRAAKAARP